MIFSSLFDIAQLVSRGFYLDLSSGTQFPFLYFIPSDSLKQEWRRDLEKVEERLDR